MCPVCLLEEEREWVEEVRSVREGRFIGEGESELCEGMLTDRQPGEWTRKGAATGRMQAGKEARCRLKMVQLVDHSASVS